MFIKIRRDTLIILLLAFILILCGRLITYVAYASSDEVTDGVPISGIIVKGNDVVPVDIIRSNVMQSGLRDGSVIHGDILKTSKKEVSLQDAIQTAQEFAKRLQFREHQLHLFLLQMFRWIKTQVLLQ